MNYLWIGKIVNTHGIKGEIRIVSDAEYKDCIFKKGVHLYIGEEKKEEIISHHRIHKQYDLVTLEGINDINEVLLYKGENLFINRDEIIFPSFLKTDLIGMDVISEKNRGKVTQIRQSKAHDLFVIDDKHLVPYVEPLIEKIDFDEKKIYIVEMKGLFDED